MQKYVCRLHRCKHFQLRIITCYIKSNSYVKFKANINTSYLFNTAHTLGTYLLDILITLCGSLNYYELLKICRLVGNYFYNLIPPITTNFYIKRYKKIKVLRERRLEVYLLMLAVLICHIVKAKIK